MYKSISILLLGIGLFACKGSITVNPNSIADEWFYVGTFDNRANYACYICGGVNYEESIYKITFDQKGKFTGKINLLIAEGTYEISNTAAESYSLRGEIKIPKLQILNKPYETEEDSKFQALFASAEYFALNTGDKNQEFDQLSLGNKGNEFLLFVRKK